MNFILQQKQIQENATLKNKTQIHHEIRILFLRDDYTIHNKNVSSKMVTDVQKTQNQNCFFNYYSSINQSVI